MAELTDKQKAELRAAMEQLGVSLEEAIKHAAQDSKPVDLDQPIGRITRIDAIQQQKMAKANLAANRRKLGLIRAGLKSIDQGDYGECSSCGETIPFKRLMAKPESQLCIECQSEHEQTS